HSDRGSVQRCKIPVFYDSTDRVQREECQSVGYAVFLFLPPSVLSCGPNSKMRLVMGKILAICLALVCPVVYGQGNNLEGRILNASGDGIPGASIHVLNTNTGTFSDGEGRFQLTLSPGKYRLHIRAIGFASVDHSVDLSSGGNTLEITMMESAQR